MATKVFDTQPITKGDDLMKGRIAGLHASWAFGAILMFCGFLWLEPASAAETTTFPLSGWAPEGGQTVRLYQIDTRSGRNEKLLNTVHAGKTGAFQFSLPVHIRNLPVRLLTGFPSSCGKRSPSPSYSALVIPRGFFGKTRFVSIGFQSTVQDRMAVLIHSRQPGKRDGWAMASEKARRQVDRIFGANSLSHPSRETQKSIDRADQSVLAIIAGWRGESSWDWGSALARDLSDSRADGKYGNHYPVTLCNRPIPAIAGTVFWREAVLTALADKHLHLSPLNQSRLARSAQMVGRLASRPSGRWKLLPPMPTPRDSILLVSGVHVPPTVIGGEAPQGVSNRVERWNEEQGRWTGMSPYPLSVSYAAGTALADGRIFVTGGFNSDGFTGASYLYIPETGHWSALAPDPTPRAGSGAVLLPDGDILVTGGETGNGITNLTERFIVRKNRWEKENGPPEGRIGGVSILMPDGRVLVLGGLLKTGGITGAGRYYNPSTRHWEERIPPSPTARLYATGALLPDGTVVVLDGFNRTGVQNSMDSFDPVRKKWKTGLPPDLVRRKETGSAVLEDGALLVVGGEDPDGTSIGNTTLFH